MKITEWFAPQLFLWICWSFLPFRVSPEEIISSLGEGAPDAAKVAYVEEKTASRKARRKQLFVRFCSPIGRVNFQTKIRKHCSLQRLIRHDLFEELRLPVRFWSSIRSTYAQDLPPLSILTPPSSSNGLTSLSMSPPTPLHRKKLVSPFLFDVQSLAEDIENLSINELEQKENESETGFFFTASCVLTCQHSAIRKYPSDRLNFDVAFDWVWKRGRDMIDRVLLFS